MQLMGVSTLLQLREQLNITREDIVRRAKVSVATVRNAEKGAKITRRSALQILQAVNSHLRESSQPEVTLDDLDLVVEATLANVPCRMLPASPRPTTDPRETESVVTHRLSPVQRNEMGSAIIAHLPATHKHRKDA